MAADNKRYEIVQISEADWGIQYAGDSLVRGFANRQAAVDAAVLQESQPNDVQVIPPVRSVEEALVREQAAKEELSQVIDRPLPTEADYAKQREAVEAEAAVQQQIRQEEQARQQAQIDADRAERDRQSQLNEATSQRDRAISDYNAIKNSTTASEEDKKAVENSALEAESYLQSIKTQQEQEKNATSDQTNTGTTTEQSALQKLFNNFGGQVESTNADLTKAGESTVGLIKDTLNNLFGSITTGQSGGNSTATGYGSSGYSGNTLYDTSTGVVSKSSSNDQRIKLSPKPAMRSKLLTGILSPLAETGGLVFPYTPKVNLEGRADYNTLETVHANQDWRIYKSTPSVEITIDGPFTAQNDTEAKYMLAAIHYLRALTKMHFGDSDDNKGLPPPQVLLDGYGTYMFNSLSVIVTNFNVNLDDNVDYVSVQTENGTSRVPVYTDISVTVIVQQTPAKARTFNWDSFADGSLMQQKGWI